MQAQNLLETSIEYLKGVGPLRAELLRKELHIFTFGDLLSHFPYRYLDSSQIRNISSLSAGQEWIQLIGTILHFREEGGAYKKRLTATLFDSSGKLGLTWFQGISWIRKNIREGQAYSVFGKLSYFNGQPNIIHPELEPLESQDGQRTLQPVYSTTEKLKAKGLSNRSFAKLLQELCRRVTPADIPEILPHSLLELYHLLSRSEAFLGIHFPIDEQQRNAAERRLKWEELFLLQLRLGRLKVRHDQQAGFRFPKVGKFFNDFFDHHMPFELTEAQKRVIREIRNDTLGGRQMNRLLQGDVGSGKTMVALMSMLLALDNGFQAVLMAPTEILAQQHLQGISDLLRAMDIPVVLLTGSVKAKARRKIMEGIASGAFPLIVGTHALLEDGVRFQNLGLAVIDEQHRFGVTQRAKLWHKNHLPPHILIMTATPIPRTLALSVYGDLNVSVIDELPPGRKPINTIHRMEHARPQVMQFLKSEIAQGRQVYIVYPLIDESEKMDYESLMAGIQQVKTWFPEPGYRVAMVHGRQPADERERNMQRFVQGHAQILVATTVIEVGVNVPNASVMIIESAERFGLSQLHQLRGRVGRGSKKSYCILLTGPGLSQESRQRMNIMVRTTDGFEIAREDLKMRGPGDIYGTRQSGALDLKIADIVHDGVIIEETHNAASALLLQDPFLERPEHQVLLGVLQKGGKHGQAWNKIS